MNRRGEERPFFSLRCACSRVEEALRAGARELGEHDEALRTLAAAKQAGSAVKTHQNEPLLIPLRNRPEFKALMR